MKHLNTKVNIMSLHDLKMRLASVQKFALLIVSFTDDPKLWYYQLYIKTLVKELIQKKIADHLIYVDDKHKHMLTVKNEAYENADPSLVIEFEHSKKGKLWETSIKYRTRDLEKNMKGQINIKNQEKFNEESLAKISELVKEFVKQEPLQD
jgi:hypothetical protein